MLPIKCNRFAVATACLAVALLPLGAAPGAWAWQGPEPKAAAHELAEKLFARHFSQADRNGDGVLQKSESIAARRRAAAQMKKVAELALTPNARWWDVTAPALPPLLEKSLKNAELAAADDAAITREEFVAALTKALSDWEETALKQVVEFAALESGRPSPGEIRDAGEKQADKLPFNQERADRRRVDLMQRYYLALTASLQKAEPKEK